MVSAEKRNSPFSVKTSIWPPTYLNCWVMVDTAFLCPVLLSMLLLYQTGSTIIWTLMPGDGFLRVINGTFNTAQHKNDPAAQQKPVGGVFGADQPGQIAPLVGVIPDGGVQHAAADCADGQLQSADPPPRQPPPGPAAADDPPAPAKGRDRPRRSETSSSAWCRARPIPARHTPRRRAKTEKHVPAYKIPLHKLYSHSMCRGRGL